MQSYSVFEETKNRIPLEAAIKYYGVGEPKKSMMCCPFHKDNTPSMSVRNNRFKCFGCGLKGDVIEFTRLLFSLSSPMEAVKKLRADFGLSEYKANAEAINKYKEVQRAEEAFDRWERKAFITLCTYFRDTLPKAMKEHINDESIMSRLLRNRATEEYLLDVLTFGEKEEKIEIYKEYRKDVKDIEERNKLYG